MVERTVILPDVHLTQDGGVKPYAIVKSFIEQYKPDNIVLLGDFMDCTSVSHWLENKGLHLEGKRMLEEFKTANVELDFLQTHSSRVVYIEGNHENWMEQYIEKHPEIEGLLEIDRNLRLKTRGIQWVPLNRLYKMGKVYLTHGCFTNKHHAAKHLMTFGCCVIYGHTHQHQTHMFNMKMQLPIMAWGIGCLCDHAPYYMKGRPANWINQFGVLETNDKTGRFNFTPVNVTDNQFIYQGKEYKWTSEK